MDTLQQIPATSIVSLFETTKAERLSFVGQVLESVKEGNTNPLQLKLQLKSMEDIIKQISDNEEYKELLLSEAQKHGKSFDYHNSKFEVKEVGTKYNYALCADPILKELEQQAEAVNAKLKERQEFLKKMPIEGIEIRREDELVHVFPPAKYSTTSVAVTLK